MSKLFHWSPYKFNKPNPSPQGIHFTEVLSVCKSLAENRGYDFNKGYIYSAEIDLSSLHPVIFEFDPMDWSAYDISAQILAKFGKEYKGGTKLYGATDVYDEEDDSYWSNDVDPRKVIIKPLSESDLLIIYEINKNSFMAKFGTNYETKINLFNQLMEVLAKYGYNCIKYKNYGENYSGSDSYIFPNSYEFANLTCIKASELRESLLEDTRSQLAAASRNAGAYKDQSLGKNRFERKRLSKIAANVKQYNNINMNDLFKHDVLQVEIPVIGETDTYKVTVKMEGVVAEIAKNIKNNNYKLEFRTIIQSLTKVFNTAQIYINCTCPDHLYNYAHWNIVHNVSTLDSAHDPGPGKGLANPHDDKGRGCKHSLLVLANGDWMMKVASVINNYIHYMSEKMQKPFLKLIFPKLYGCDAEEMARQDILGKEEVEDTLETGTSFIDAINEYGKNRGKFKKGSNINPVYADELAAEQKAKEDDIAQQEDPNKKNLDKAEQEAEEANKEAEEEAKQAEEPVEEPKEEPKEEPTDKPTEEEDKNNK